MKTIRRLSDSGSGVSRVVGVLRKTLRFLALCSLFGRVRRVAAGYLGANVYREIWSSARRAPAGFFVDIGPGQGGSTISLGLAAKKRSDGSRVLTFDRFAGSAAMLHGDHVEQNVHQLRRNLRRFRVEEWVKIHVVPKHTPETIIQDGRSISVLFIDADGALDRDFLALYKWLAPGASVIVDDFDPRVNKQGKKLLGYSDDELQRLLERKGASSLEMLLPFGKHHTTWLFVTILLKHELLFVDKLIGNTVFLRVPDPRPSHFSQELLESEFALLRQYIYQSFEHVRSLRRNESAH